MRKEFIETLVEIAKKDKRIVFLTADLGYTVVEPFAQEFPERFFNVGVAEQNMVGLATGLAEAGFIPFVYSIVNFAAIRPYEFIRNGPILHQLPVRIVGVGGGFEYGPAGITHYGLEDIGLMRIQNDITIVVPADHNQVKNALIKTWDIPGPVYFRIGKGQKDPIANLNGAFSLGKLQQLKEGNDVLFITLGGLANNVLQAAEDLNKKNISSSVYLLSNIDKSLTESLLNILKNYQLIVTVEDHYLHGGIGSLVAEIIAQNSINCRLLPCAVGSLIGQKIGGKDFLNNVFGLSAEKITQKVINCLQHIQP